MNSDCKLLVKNVTKNFVTGISVLKNITFTFETKKTYAITGASGSGKSTLLHIIGGLDYPTSGDVLLNNQIISSQKEKNSILNEKIGFVFQFHYLIKELTVLENISLMAKIKGKSVQEAKQESLALIKIIGLEDKKNAYPTTLSGGEQQRISILRALINKPKFILADEPTGNLDRKNVDCVIDLLLKGVPEWGLGLILCTHDKSVWERMDMIFELRNGKFIINKK